MTMTTALQGQQQQQEKQQQQQQQHETTIQMFGNKYK